MGTSHSQKKRWFPHSDETDSMMNDNEFKPKFTGSPLSNFPQLVLCHFPVRFVLNSINLPPVFGAANNPPKINCRTRGKIDINWQCLEQRFGY
jgi:hypothetical protein